MKSDLFRFASAAKRHPAVEVWMREHSDELGLMAQRWFKVMHDCGDDVRELLHDGQPTACAGDAASRMSMPSGRMSMSDSFEARSFRIRLACWKGRGSA